MGSPPCQTNSTSRRRLGLDVTPDEGGKDIVRHAVILSGAEQGLFLEVKAVLAVEIAGRAYGLGHDVDTRAGIFAALVPVG